MPIRVSFFLMLGLCLLVACERQADRALTMEEVRAEGEPVQESWGARYFVAETPGDTAVSRPRLAFEAGYLARYERADTTYLLLRPDPEHLDERVTAQFFDSTGDSSAMLTADEVQYFDTLNRFEARGQVVVVTKEGKRLESEHLVWLERDRSVRTNGFVRITTSTEQIQGYDLVADENLDTYTLRRPTGQVTVEE